MYQYLPCDDYCIRMKLLGKCGSGNEEEKQDKAMQLYLQACEDKKVRNTYVHGHWLIGVFRGTEERVGDREEHRSGFKRRKPSTTRLTKQRHRI